MSSETTKTGIFVLGSIALMGLVRGIQNTIRLLAVTLPPVPAFVLFILVWLNRLRRERIGVAEDRLVSGGQRQ